MAVNSVICVSSDISAIPLRSSYSVMPFAPYFLNIDTSVHAKKDVF